MDSAPKYPRSLHKDSVTFCKALMQKNPKKRLGCEGLPAKGNSDVKVSYEKRALKLRFILDVKG